MIALLNILGFCFILKIVPVISNRVCPSGGKECEIGNWLEWGKCDATCGGGYRIRRKPICCNINYDKTLDECLQHCKMDKSNFNNITTDSKSCAPYCYNSGHFNTATNKCECRKGSYGICCDKSEFIYILRFLKNNLTCIKMFFFHILKRCSHRYMWRLVFCSPGYMWRSVFCSPGYMWRSVFCSHVENTCMTTSFHSKGRIRPIKLV
jgi:hypothetical protein